MNVYTLCTPTHEGMFERYLFPTATTAGFNVIKVEADQACATGTYLEAGWTETMKQKILMLIEASKKHRGEIFIYSDCDTVFNPKNFNPEIAAADLGNGYAAFQDDVVQICAGFMILRGGDVLDRLLGLTLNGIDEFKEDQTAFNAVIKKFDLEVSVLPRKHYFCIRQLFFTLTKERLWNGKAFKIPKNMKIFHANWTQGIAQKSRLLEMVYNLITI